MAAPHNQVEIRSLFLQIPSPQLILFSSSSHFAVSALCARLPPFRSDPHPSGHLRSQFCSLKFFYFDWRLPPT